MNPFRHLSMVGELVRVLGALEGAGIRAVPFKGPVLAACFYGDPTLRPYADLDILVLRRDVARAQELLRSSGYRPLQARSRWFEPHAQWSHSDRQCVVELHWDLMPRSFYVPLDPEGFLSRARPIDFGDRRVLSFSDEDLLLFLCVHGSKHLWERPIWVRDVAQILKARPSLDWERLLGTAERAGAKRMLLLGLLLARDLFGAELPAQVERRAARDSQARCLTEKMKERLSRGAVGPFGFWEMVPLYLRMRERWRDKIRDCVGHALTLATPTDKDLKFVPLPRFLSWLYVLVRPVRLGGGFLKRMVLKC